MGAPAGAHLLARQSCGHSEAVSSEIGVNCETVRDWSYTWRVLGREEFLAGAKEERVTYPPE